MKKLFCLLNICFSISSFSQNQAKDFDVKTLHKIFDVQITLIDTDRDSAKVIFKQIEPSLKKLNDDKLNFRFHHEWSRIGYLDSDYESALNHAKIALNLAKKLKNQVFEARASRLMMVMSHRLNKDVEAMKYAVITAKLLENSKDSLMLASTYNSISSFYSDFEIDEKALYFSLKSIETAKKYNDTKGLLGGINNAASAYIQLKKYPEAIALSKEQIKIATLQNKLRSVERAYTNLCNTFIATDNLSELNIYFPKFKKFIEANGDEIMKDDNWSNFYDDEARYHLYNLRFESAEKSINKALEFAEKSTYKKQLIFFYLTKSDIYTALHKFEKATIYFDKSDSLERSMRDLELIKYGEELETKYKLTQKENEILQKDLKIKESQNKFWLLGGGFLIISMLAGLGFYSFRKNQIAKNLQNELETQKLERQRIASEMHDELGGNLTSLMYLAHNLKIKNTESVDNQQVDKIIRTSSEISESINEIVWALNQRQNSLTDWVFYTKEKVVELLENSDLEYAINIPNNIPDRTLTNIEKRNLYLVVKEAVNNSIRHAQAKTIAVKMDFEKQIMVEISDDGIGFTEKSEPKAGTGNGLKNMKNRMTEIGGKISWQNGNGTTVELRLRSATI